MAERRSPPNQRHNGRRPIFIRALLLREDKSNLPCTLVDISDTGARLIVEDTSEVPDRFTIVMTEQGVPRRSCRLIWRGETDIGVVFEADKSDSKVWNRVLEPGSSLQDALDTFARHSH